MNNTKISHHSFQNYTILIIDDNPTNLGVIVDYLEEAGFDILIARDGETGLKRAQMAKPKLILLDVMMPDIDGFETCRRLKADEKTQDIPIIFMTALDNVEDKVKGFKMGGIDYLTKPIQHEEVFARINTHLRIRDLTVKLNAKVDELTQTQQNLVQKIDELNQTRQELIHSEKMASLGRLVAGFAHELNTPIGVAVSSASTLQKNVLSINQLVEEQEEVDEEDLLDVLETVNESATLTLSNLKRAANLVKSFKRTAVHQSSEQVTHFKVKALIEDVINMLQNRFKRMAIQVQVDCPEDLAIKSLPGALEQILTNLIMNSLIHGFNQGQQAGSINIKVQLDGEDLHLEYSDTGKGIASENLSKIFEPFFTTHRAHGGSGLGLYICYNLITTQLQGTITCESTVGNGVVFKIDYPIDIQSES
jgi:signal transduction histidine kinase